MEIAKDESYPMESGLPLISIVTCSYQQSRYLEQTMRSVLDQDYPALEYLVIDGASRDGSVEIIRRHAHALAYWVSEPDGGQTQALIKGFARARGEICGWLCSDDLLLPGALRTVGEFFAAHPKVAALYGDALWIDAEGRFLRPKREIDFNRFVLLYDHNYIPQPSMFWRRSLYEAVGGLDERFELAMDADLWERFSARTRIAHLPAYLSCMRYYADQKTRARRDDALRENALIRAREPLPMRGSALRLCARALRVGAKLRAGGYAAPVPDAHLDWLRRIAAPRAALTTARPAA
jgi:glycosyltransferase involved in cell wall biosynthesis